MLLTQNATASLFTVTVNGVNVQPDVTSVNYTASLQCSSGATNVAFFCGKSPNPSAQQAYGILTEVQLSSLFALFSLLRRILVHWSMIKIICPIPSTGSLVSA
jgi:hypothetical protein